MFNPNKDLDWIIELRSLLPDWDGEGASVPSKESILKSQDIVDWVILNNLNIDSINADVLGGVGIYLNGVQNRVAWISILNSGSICIILRCRPHSKVMGRLFSDSALEELKSFLLNDDCSLCN